MDVPFCVLTWFDLRVEIKALVTVRWLSLSLIIQSLWPKSCLFVDLFSLLNVICAHLFLFLHHGIFAVELLNNIAVRSLHLVSALFSVLNRFCRQRWLLLKRFLDRDVRRLRHSRILHVCLSLQFVNVEAFVLGCDFGLTSLANLQIAILVEDNHSRQTLLVFYWLTIDLAL